MKAALVLLVLLLSGLAPANDALILISPERAGPIVDETSYVHGEWILWPPMDRADGQNRILSLLTGLDWQSSNKDLVFGRHDSHYESTAIPELQARGYFLARDRIIAERSFAIGSDSGLVSPIALFLAIEGRTPEVTPLTFRQPWPPGIIFAEVDGWDRVAEITRKAGGRVLVIEYPPPSDRRWSRYWLRGEGWGNRLPLWKAWNVPGLIPASQAGNLVTHPNRFQWVENNSENWGGANRWLSFNAYTAPLAISILGFLTAFFIGCTIYLVSKEEHAKFGGTATKYLTLIPAAVLISGNLTRMLGFSGVLLWFLAAFFTLVCASQLLGSLAGKLFPNAHHMFAITVVGFTATAASPPLWSFYSNVLGPISLPLSPEGVGAFFAYLVCVCALGRGSSASEWIARTIALVTFLWGVAGNPWWVSSQWPFVVIPLIALAIGERLFRVWMLPVFALLPLADGRLIGDGFVWAPGNLFPAFAHSEGINLARHAEFLVSPGFLGSAAVAGAIAICVEKYFFHEMRRTLLRDSRIKAPFFAAYSCAAMGLFQPLMLYPALICFVGGTLVLLTDTARAI